MEEDIDSLKETIHMQQKLLHKLYNELDAEREASSTAASEALSVILRLQAEKAAVKMEAEQYKRLVEEKMSHAEESLAIFEDVIYQKEMEVAALDRQVRAYKYKFLGAGGADPDIYEMKFPENLSERDENLSESKEAVAGNTNLQSIGRRSSLPVPLRCSYPKKGSSDRESSTTPDADSISKILEEHTMQEINDQISDIEKMTDHAMTGDIHSYWEQINKLDEQVKEIEGSDYGNFWDETSHPSPISSQLSSGNQYDLPKSRNKTRSPSPQVSAGNPYDPEGVTIVNELGQTKTPANLSENGATTDSPCSPSVHDVFEVPRLDQNCKKPCDFPAKDGKKIGSRMEGLEKAYHPIHPEAINLCDNVEPDWLKKLLQSVHHENNLSAIKCHMAVDLPTTSVSKLNQRSNASEIVEDARPTVVQESANRMEELRLLNEIKEKINSLHHEVKSLKKRKSSQKEELSLVPLMEDMLHFWL